MHMQGMQLEGGEAWAAQMRRRKQRKRRYRGRIGLSGRKRGGLAIREGMASSEGLRKIHKSQLKFEHT